MSSIVNLGSRNKIIHHIYTTFYSGHNYYSFYTFPSFARLLKHIRCQPHLMTRSYKCLLPKKEQHKLSDTPKEEPWIITFCIVRPSIKKNVFDRCRYIQCSGALTNE